MIIHVANVYRANSELERGRLARAQKTWGLLGQAYQGMIRTVYREGYGRSSLDLKDTRSVPYVKDVIASAEARSDDIVVMTNADSCLAVETLDVLVEKLVGGGVKWSSRYDVDKPMKSQLTVAQIVGRGQPHRGLDLVAFRYDWWMGVQDRYPDLLIGAEFWDAAMILVAGIENQVGPLVYHEEHQPYWFQYRKVSVSNLYNRRVGREWLIKEGLFERAVKLWPGVRAY